jgi:molybdopterin converting factor subunit 1
VKVRILYFASFREARGLGEEERRVPDGATVEDLWQALRRELPELARLPGPPPAAVNREYVPHATLLREGDEVAFLPPIAGG